MHFSEKPYAGLAIITDLDGTLLTPTKIIAPEDMAAIADFRAKGGILSVATGRGVQAALPFLDQLQPDFPAVLYNGAMIYDHRTAKIAYAVQLPDGIREILSELISAFPQIGAEVLSEEGVFVLQLNEYERRHLEITHIPIVMKTIEEARPERCIKALFAGAEEDISRLFAYTADARFSGVAFTRSDPTFLEILPLHTSKGTALSTLRQSLPDGLLIAAAGDFDNDLEMLQTADFAACPANSQPPVLETVNTRTGFISQKTCKDGFFADFIAAFTERYGKTGEPVS